MRPEYWKSRLPVLPVALPTVPKVVLFTPASILPKLTRLGIFVQSARKTNFHLSVMSKVRLTLPSRPYPLGLRRPSNDRVRLSLN